MGEPTKADMQAKIAAFSASLMDRIAALADVRLDAAQVMDRSPYLSLAAPCAISSNGQCRLIRCRDGWLAVNLPRADDRELLPAWLGVVEDASDLVLDQAMAERTCDALLDDAILMGLAAAKVGERGMDKPFFRQQGGAARVGKIKKIVDLSSLWAGPLCGAIWAAAGYQVVKIESITRPDPVRTSTPDFDEILNGKKQRRAIDFRDSGALMEELLSADMVISSARPRAFAALGISPEAIWAQNPMLNWVAITGHGWENGQGMRVGFGDDCAAAAGLVAWDNGQAEFVGDALGDPLTGLLAAVQSLEVRHLGGVFLDMSLAGSAAMARAFNPT